MNINLIIFDENNRLLDELSVEMRPPITAKSIIDGLKREAPELLPLSADQYSIMVEPASGSSSVLTGNLLEEGANVIIKPAVFNSGFKITKRKNS